MNENFILYDFMRHYNIPMSGYIDYPFHFSYHSNREIMHKVFNNFFKIAEKYLDSSFGINLVCRGSSGVYISKVIMLIMKERVIVRNIILMEN